jgi:hypothetical protein
VPARVIITYLLPLLLLLLLLLALPLPLPRCSQQQPAAASSSIYAKVPPTPLRCVSRRLQHTSCTGLAQIVAHLAQ